MNTFKCYACGNTVYFENIRCLRCSHALGFQPLRLDMATLGPPHGALYREIRRSTPIRYAYCENMQQGGCNWLVPEGSPTPYCTACAMNRTIPNLSEPKNVDAWRSFERAKKRLVYSLLRFGLPLDGSAVGKVPLTFDFISDALTGHLDGVITIAVGEADAVERERQRKAMAETYRSLLGHLRHESGHYYWMLLVDGTSKIDEYRELFGDERVDYGAALERHHVEGPPPDWALKHVSAYASSHPWEDWAETWAHYMHIVDALETAAVHKIEPQPMGFTRNGPRPAMPLDVYRTRDFEVLVKRWVPLALALNDINRSMGHGDFYPFVIPEVAVKKLDFVHRVIRSATAEAARETRRNDQVRSRV